MKIPLLEKSAARSWFAVTLMVSVAACAQTHGSGAHQHGPAQGDMPDGRLAVEFPEPLRTHTLANMREHLAALGEIQLALSTNNFDRAASIAESRLGMSSMEAHGAHDVARFMPEAMQNAGTAMHRSASQFAIVAKDASATGDLKAPLAALARVNQACVACHAGFRLK